MIILWGPMPQFSRTPSRVTLCLRALTRRNKGRTLLTNHLGSILWPVRSEGKVSKLSMIARYLLKLVAIRAIKATTVL